jgi:signal transduction histidine kinase
MKRLKLYIVLFCLVISIPLTIVILRTSESLAREEKAQLSFFAETLFDQMERELAQRIQQEENRAVDEYHHTVMISGSAARRSPLAEPPGFDFILGYLQNNPDGTFQTPLAADLGSVPDDRRPLVERLQQVNQIFNKKKFHVVKSVPTATIAKSAPERKKEAPAEFSDRFLSRSTVKSDRSYLGQKEIRVEEISPHQALNIAPEAEAAQDDETEAMRTSQALEAMESQGEPWRIEDRSVPAAAPAGRSRSFNADSDFIQKSTVQELLQVEVAPFQSVLIDREQVFIFRRIAVNNQIYRQGFVLLTGPFLRHMAGVHFESQPLSGFARLSLSVIENGQKHPIVQTGAALDATPVFNAERIFAAPYGFLSADLQAENIPASPARRPLMLAVGALSGVLLIGLLAIYQSARTVVDMSERRTRFVSSVTHELKTPLTNIRMYIEMLENGIASTPHREQEYLRILGSESTRLSRLIENVLELARLEKRQRRLQWQTGDLSDVLEEVKAVMGPQLAQEGFALRVDATELPRFAYDREVLIQVLLNLIENSIKFGRSAPLKQITIEARQEQGWIRLAVSDSGPGIPRKALRRIFDDFYRAENELTRSTGGTGLGLSLVKKFINAMGGRVQAVNNPASGCTIVLLLPLKTPAAS